MPLPRDSSELETALARLRLQRLEQLGLVHLTVAKSLRSILRGRQLIPSHCEKFGTRLLYFSYGLPYYRPKYHQTEEVLEFPVALAFGANSLSKMARFYPYDTGGAADGVFGPIWKTFLSKFDQLYVTTNPERLVSCFYGSNSSYLRGRVRPYSARGSKPVDAIHRFLAQDMSLMGADQRQRTIECIADEPFQLLDALDWVAYPATATTDIGLIWKACNQKFRSRRYIPDVNDNPASLVSWIRNMAREDLKHLWESPNAS